MARLTPENVTLARKAISRYPQPRSALIPLLHLAQEQDGWVSPEAMAHIAELLGLTPAEVLGTCSFYEMFKREPVGTYLVNVCTNLSCMLLGSDEVMETVCSKLGVAPGQTTPDGQFTVEEAECQAACADAPCFQVNYRYFTNQTAESAAGILDDLRAGRLRDVVPEHGILSRVRQDLGDARVVDGEARS